jgi:hypothetical protein
MSTKLVKRQVAPLEHVVHPQGHVMQEKWKEASSTLGARGTSWRARCIRKMERGEWRPWSTWCVLKDMPHSYSIIG